MVQLNEPVMTSLLSISTNLLCISPVWLLLTTSTPHLASRDTCHAHTSRNETFLYYKTLIKDNIPDIH